MSKTSYFHDSGLNWALETTDNGVYAQVKIDSFVSKDPRFFTPLTRRKALLDFDKSFNAYLQAEPQGYVFTPGSIVDNKIMDYIFSHEDINRMLTIPVRAENQLINAFLGTIKEFRATYFSCSANVI